MAPESLPALVVGAGPAGLMAAEALARAGHGVVVAEAKPSPARKLLMAGKSGLNLTKDEPDTAFRAAFTPADPLRPMLDAFGPREVQEWARDLGQEVFTGSTGRVFPVAMKASPLLRAWLGRLAGLGVRIRPRWRWTGWEGEAFRFDTPEGTRTVIPHVTVLALGGASWRRLGSDGEWTELLRARGVVLTPFRPANVGLSVAFSPHMARHFGAPVKNVGLIVGGITHRGEIVLTRNGFEGGGLYPLAPRLREGAALAHDLMPDLDAGTLAARFARTPRASVSNRLRKAGLDPVRVALVLEFGRPLPETPSRLAALVKGLAIPHQGARPLDEAISTAGGIAWEAVSEGLELHALPRVFAAGEMLDWEAPTGGYLITACLATGRHAGAAAAARLTG